jgi:hypothetical protein
MQLLRRALACGKGVDVIFATGVAWQARGSDVECYEVIICSAQTHASAKSGYSSAQAMEEVFAQNMRMEMGYDYMGMSYREKKAQAGVCRRWSFSVSRCCACF